MDSTLIHTKLDNIRTLTLEWGEAGGLFLSIEPLMRYLAEINKGIADRIDQLITADKFFKNKLYVHYWDCDAKYLIEAIEAEFGPQLSSAEMEQLKKYPPMRGKFLHGNFIELMKVMSIKPIIGKSKRLEPGQMKKGNVFQENSHLVNNFTGPSENLFVRIA